MKMQEQMAKLRVRSRATVELKAQKEMHRTATETYAV